MMRETDPKKVPKFPSADAPKKKMGWMKKVIIFILLIFLVMQFFQPDKNNNDVVASKSILSMVPTSDTVNKILRVACFDCHSNNTQYPWYTNIQPVGWWLANHIEEGKGELNFSNFVAYEKDTQIKKLQAVKKSQKDGWMPLSSYTWIHTEAKLDAGQKKLLIDWADSAINLISAMPQKD